MMSDETLYRFPAQMESLAAVLAHIAQASDGADRAMVVRAQTAVEELFSNSVLHGGPAPPQADSVWVGARLADGQLQVRIEDAFAAFDPFSQLGSALRHSELPVEQRPVGGLGILMVHRLADQAHYSRTDGRNRITLHFTPRHVS